MSNKKPALPLRHAAVGGVLALSLSGVLSAAALSGSAPAAPKRPAPKRPVAKRPVVKRTAAAASNGEQVFRARCASCHGAKGEGAKGHPKPLAGTRSVADLSTFIHRSMPPGAAKKPSAAQAKAVAAYIHGAFYSPLAQERNRPARIELSRLTVRQLRHAMADLVGSFRAAPRPDERRGLRGRYYKGRLGRGDALIDRIDPQVRFDFKQESPGKEIDDPYQFSMRWEGGVLAPETGDYEFIVRTEQALRLWVNDLNQPAIDAYVKSGNDTEYRASLFLIGGRVYPIRLEFLKSQQGVNNQERLRAKPPEPASISLEWKLPKRAAEVIPQRALIPVDFPETFVLATPFPPDDRSIGYERGNSVSKEWDEATTEAAIETAAYVVKRLPELAKVADENAPSDGGRRRRGEGGAPPAAAPEDPAERGKKVQAFCRQFVERAFRRPLTPDLAQVYVERQFKDAPDLDSAVRRVVLLTLKSPRFLFREMGSGQPDPYDVASRLAFGLWDSLPDEALLKAAAGGELATREQVVRQAERMVDDLRTRAKLRDFFMQWLKVEHYPDLAKDAKRYPGFDAPAQADLRTSLELLVDDIIWSDRSDFRDLLLTDKVYLNGRLAKLYGVALPEDAPFQLVTLDKERAGVLTHPYLLASFAYLDTSSPIHRGVLIARSLLGRTLLPPPDAFTPLPADLHPKLTTRQRVELQTKPGACNTCHSMINPLGFTLEKFDAIGRLRAEENGQPVDATGGYRTRAGKTVKFTGVRDLAKFLATSDEAHAAFTEQLFQHLVKQPVRAFGSTTHADLTRSFTANAFSIRKQLVETLATSALGKSTSTSTAAADRGTRTRTRTRTSAVRLRRDQ